MNDNTQKQNLPVKAPFTDEQLKNINDWQNCGLAPPLKCGGSAYCQRKGKHPRILFPTQDGLVCSCCIYKQDWVPEMVANFDIELAKSSSAMKGLIEAAEKNKLPSPFEYQRLVDTLKENAFSMTIQEVNKNALGMQLEEFLVSLPYPEGITWDDTTKAVDEYLESGTMSFQSPIGKKDMEEIARQIYNHLTLLSI